MCDDSDSSVRSPNPQYQIHNGTIRRLTKYKDPRISCPESNANLPIEHLNLLLLAVSGTFQSDFSYVHWFIVGDVFNMVYAGFEQAMFFKANFEKEKIHKGKLKVIDRWMVRLVGDDHRLILFF